jgi:glycosyltransferase involved in cell wall biosynthesis
MRQSVQTADKDSEMRVLVIADTYSVDGSSPWLIEDLVDALARAGHQVDVLVKDMTIPRPRGLQVRDHKSVRVYSVGVGRAPSSRWRRRLRLPAAMLRLRTEGVRWARSEGCDAVIFTSIAWTKAGVPAAIASVGSSTTVVLVYWDFFPVHQREIGHFRSLPPVFDPILRMIERRAVHQADVVALMTPKNVDFYASYFGARGQDVVLLPPWGSDQAAMSGTTSSRRSQRPFTAVFGGQLTAGRGLEELLDAAEVLLRDASAIQLQIFGSGPLEKWLRDSVSARGLSNVTLMGQLPRGDYSRALVDAHCGIAATVEGVSVPTFPSKIVDYCSAALPVLVSAERSGDVGEWIESRGAGIGIPAGSPSQLAAALQRFELAWRARSPWMAMSAASRSVYETELSADVAAQRVVAAVGVAQRRRAAQAS